MKHCRLRLLNFLVCFAALIGVNAAVAAEKLRYLFLVDHSPAMATRQLPTVDTINYLVRSGFENQIQPGEKFAIWFYGSRLQTNAPLTWQPGREVELARFAANLFTGRIYGRIRPREKTLADAAPFIAASPKITIFIFTDGSQPLSGTPYDASINNEIEKHRLEFQIGEKPFIITLTSKNGEWIGGHIHTDVNHRFENPELELPNDLANKALAAVRATPPAKTNNPAEMDKALAALRSAPASVQNQTGEIDKARDVLRDALAGNNKPADTNAPIPASVMQFAPTLKDPPKEQPAQPPKDEAKPPEPKTGETKKEEPVKLAAAPVVPPAQIETPKPQEPKPEPPPKKIDPIETKPTEVAAAPPVIKTPEPIPTVVAKTPEPPPIVTQSKEEPKRVLREQPNPKPTLVAQAPPPKSIEPTPAPAEAPKPPTSTPTPQIATVTPRAKSFPWPALAVGLFVIAACGAVAVLNARKRAKSAGSIITQALPHDGIPRPRK